MRWGFKMNDRPIINNSANDFTVRMSIRRVDIDREISILRGQINLLKAQSIITEDTEDLLWHQLREIIAHKNKIESDYYDMRKTLEQHENNKERLFSWLQAMSHEDSARGQFARETLNYAEQKEQQ